MKIESNDLKQFLDLQIKKAEAEKIFASYSQFPAYNARIQALKQLIKYVEQVEQNGSANKNEDSKV